MPWSPHPLGTHEALELTLVATAVLETLLDALVAALDIAAVAPPAWVLPSAPLPFSMTTVVPHPKRAHVKRKQSAA